MMVDVSTGAVDRHRQRAIMRSSIGGDSTRVRFKCWLHSAIYRSCKSWPIPPTTIAEGEVLQPVNGDLSTNERYRRVIACKTAQLSAAAHRGAIIAGGADTETQNHNCNTATTSVGGFSASSMDVLITPATAWKWQKYWR